VEPKSNKIQTSSENKKRVPVALEVIDSFCSSHSSPYYCSFTRWGPLTGGADDIVVPLSIAFCFLRQAKIK